MASVRNRPALGDDSCYGNLSADLPTNKGHICLRSKNMPFFPPWGGKRKSESELTVPFTMVLFCFVLFFAAAACDAIVPLL